MTIDTIKIKLFGKTSSLFRVFKDGELLQVFEQRADAEKWIAAQ